MKLSYNNFCEEFLLEKMEAILEFEEKDRKRIEDFFSKSKGDFEKVKALAVRMANSITNAEKAFNRAEAAKSVMGTKPGENNPIADIFYERAKELGYDVTKIPVSTPEKDPIKTDVTNQEPPAKEKVKREPRPKKVENIEITHVPTEEPGSKLPEDKQFKSTKSPIVRPGKSCIGAPVLPIGEVEISTGKCILFDKLDDSLYDNWTGTVEVWKLMNDKHVLVFTADTDPTVQIGTPCTFIHDQSGAYLFYGELVDYIRVIDMSALIGIYGNVLPGYTYK